MSAPLNFKMTSLLLIFERYIECFVGREFWGSAKLWKFSGINFCRWPFSNYSWEQKTFAVLYAEWEFFVPTNNLKIGHLQEFIPEKFHGWADPQNSLPTKRSTFKISKVELSLQNLMERSNILVYVSKVAMSCSKLNVALFAQLVIKLSKIALSG